MTNIGVSFNNIKILFDYLNSNCDYLVLRNWDDVFNESIYGNGHEDIDILCSDLTDFIDKTSACRVHNNPHRDNFVISCGGGLVRFDIRWIGDGYYPTAWEKRMLENRIMTDDGIYIMNPVDYCFSLSYHALVQKPVLSNEYCKKVKDTFKTLDGYQEPNNEDEILKNLRLFMGRESYKCVLPQDPGVFVNWTNFNKLQKIIKPRLLLRRVVFRINDFSTRVANKLKRLLASN